MVVTKEIKKLLNDIPLDKGEVDAIVDFRGVDRKVARLAYRLSIVDHVDLAELIIQGQEKR